MSQEKEANQSEVEESNRLQRQKEFQEEQERKDDGSKSQEQQAEDVAAFLAGEGGVATGVVAMDTTPPSGDGDLSSVPPLQSQEEQVGQEAQTGQTDIEEPVKPVEPAQPGIEGTEQWQWPQEQQQQQSLGLTATNPDLAQVLPQAPAIADTTPFGGDYSTAESANSSSVVPSAPPPTYDQIAGSQPGSGVAYDAANAQPAGGPLVGGGVPSGYDPAYQQPQVQAPPPGSAYFPPSYATPPPGPYGYQYGAPPPPTGGAVPPYGQQFSSPSPTSQSYSSAANWGSFDTTGSSDVPSQQESHVPYVDRSTKPSSLSALSTGWGGESVYAT